MYLQFSSRSQLKNIPSIRIVKIEQQILIVPTKFYRSELQIKQNQYSVHAAGTMTSNNQRERFTLSLINEFIRYSDGTW